MKRASLIIASTVASLAACGGKTDAAATPAADTTAAAPAAVAPADTTKPAADAAAKPAADTTPKPAPSAKPAARNEAGDYDRAVKPKFTIDEKSGKIDTIRKKP